MSGHGPRLAHRARRCALAFAIVLAGCQSGGESVSDGEPEPPIAAPTLTFTATPGSVNAGASSALTWSTTGATTCTASGAWSGSRPTSGNANTGPLNATSTFSLDCSGAGGSIARNVTVNVQPATPAPTLTLTANPGTIASGETSALTWSTTNATGCTASGGWSGNKSPSGSQTVGPLTTSTNYTLQCTGGGGTVSKSVTVTVMGSPPPAPTVNLTANPTSVTSGENSTLTWNSANATSCSASGGWSGNKNPSGSQSVGPLTTSTSYTLQCTGSGGTTSRTVTVTVTPATGAALSGGVDSGLIDEQGTNRVYVWQGDVTPDDFDGDAGDPVAALAVVQAQNACTFGFQSNALAAGTYTVAFTADAADDAPLANNALTFVGRAVIAVGATPAVRNFGAARVLQVGPTRPFTTVLAANDVAQPGDVIEIDAGTYQDDISVWRQNDVTLRGVGGRAHLRAVNLIPFVSGDDQRNGKGIWVIQGSRIRVENIEFSGSRVPDENGAGIRNEGDDLTVCNGYFHDNENGFLGGAYGTLTIEYSEFANNGHGDIGRTHNIYVDDGGASGDRLIFRHNYSHHAHIGHTLKTRARENHILYNRIMDEDDGDSSYIIDVPNGGLTFIIGNLLQQSPFTDNSDIVSFGAEGLSSGRPQELYVIGNTVVNDLGSGAFFNVAGGATTFRSVNNLLVGTGTVYSGKQPQATTNLQTTGPGLVNIDGFDYRLLSNSPARDAGSNPGNAGSVDLTAIYQYVHRAHREARTANGPIDIGAYEFR